LTYQLPVKSGSLATVVSWSVAWKTTASTTSSVEVYKVSVSSSSLLSQLLIPENI
jgi:hypothetical protein